MDWTKTAGFVSVVLLVAGCPGEDKGRCTLDSECPEGMWCDTNLALCVKDCKKMGCLDGHFCNPETDLCVTECPFTCPKLPENATATCSSTECGYTCNPPYYLDAGGSCATCDVAEHCGASCEKCHVPDNGDAVCNGGTCGIACKGGYYDAGGSCSLCNVIQHCGASCIPCESGQICNEFGTACITGPRFEPVSTVLYEPMVMDHDNNLVWQGCPAGLTGNDCTLDENGSSGGTATPMNWYKAVGEYNATSNPDTINYCGSLSWGGKGGWRLPTEDPNNTSIQDELEFIRDMTQAKAPYIDLSVFPNTPASSFWSSSSYANGRDYGAWYVDFGDGGVGYYRYEIYTTYVRCVRSGP